MIRRSHLVTFGLALAGLTVSLAASAALSLKGQPAVTFLANGTLGMKINGTSSDLRVSEKDGKITVLSKLDKLKTGIDKRDEHMKDKYLHVGKYPDAVLVVPRDKLKFPAGGKSEGELSGDFSLHGTTKNRKFQYVAEPAGDGVKVTGTMNINIVEFGVEQPNMMGVKVDPNIAVKVVFTVKDN